MKLINIVNAHEAIDSIGTNDIGAHLAYIMTKFFIVTQPDVDFYSNEVKKLFDKFGETSEDGNVVIKKENVKLFQDSLRELQDTEAQDPGIRFSLSEISDNLKVSMKQIYPIMPFIQENE